MLLNAHCPSRYHTTRAGGDKTLSSSMLVPWPFVYYTRKFTAKAFVSHNTAVSLENLSKIDMLPKIRFKMLLTPELLQSFLRTKTNC